jgi:hypothetical protein
MADGDALIIGSPNQASGTNGTQLRLMNRDPGIGSGFEVLVPDGEGVTAIHGQADPWIGLGIYGEGGAIGVLGTAAGTGVEGRGNPGVLGSAVPPNGVGIRAYSELGWAVLARSEHSTAVFAQGGVVGIRADSGAYGVSALANDVGVYTENTNPAIPLPRPRAYLATRFVAGDFYGNVHVRGTQTVTKMLYRIDHPDDPANRYLSHSAVASSEAKNVYDGIANLDGAGTATVEMPSWFESLNGDFRYQLTSIGGPAPELHVASELIDGRFKIAGGQPNGRVSWLITGVRCDPWAETHPDAVEMDKPENERGSYIYPDLVGVGPELDVRLRRYTHPNVEAPSPLASGMQDPVSLELNDSSSDH